MADKSPKKYDISPPRFDPLPRTPTQKKYWFLEGRLYKTLRQNRPSDILTALDMETRKLVEFSLSDAKRKMKPAYDTKEVERFLNRTHVWLRRYVTVNKAINPPAKIEGTAINSRGVPFSTWKWSEEDILALHDFLLSYGSGRPRKDGTVGPGARLPTRTELLAMLRNQPMFYMQTSSGEMVPVWSAYNEV